MPNADELWGTFAVDDHLRKRAFVAETVLFDRLVLPVPSPEDSAEFDVWRKNGWQPERVVQTIDLLEGLAIPVVWDRTFRERWQESYGAEIHPSSAEGRFAIGQAASFDVKGIKAAPEDNPAKWVTRMVLADRMSDEADET
jgi:hypothetical protein